EFRPIDDLQPHPLNAQVYGDEGPDPELVESIRQYGIIEPLQVCERVIISGHRRWRAAAKAGLREVPVYTLGLASRLEEFGRPETKLAEQLLLEQHLLESNRQRKKTTEQLAREAKELLRIETALASARQQQGKKKGGKTSGRGRHKPNSLVEPVPPSN